MTQAQNMRGLITQWCEPHSQGKSKLSFEEYCQGARLGVKYIVGFFPMPTSLLSALYNHGVIWWKHTILLDLWSTEIGRIYIPQVTTKI